MTRILTLALVALVAAGCSLTDPEADVNPEPGDLSPAARAVVRSDNDFGLDLFKELTATGTGNVFMSPTSVSLALGMTANGASGETYAQMIGALRKQGLDATEVNESYRDLTNTLTTLDPKVQLEIANSIWYREGYPVLPSFLDVNRDYFDAEVAELDFGSPASVDRINGWVDDRTHGLIDKVVDQIPGNVVMYLINAIYFKGTWLYEFDPAETTTQAFANADGTHSEVPMMAMQADLPVFRGLDFTAVDLPYGDSLFSMTVVLPDLGTDPDQIMAGVDSGDLDSWIGGFEARDTILRLPRFKVEYKESLVPMLKAMGIEAAFAPGGADFSRLVDGGGPWISDVIHQSVIDVNEEGTEAAAVTTVIIIESAGAGPLHVTVDRPFLLFIRARTTGSVLFMGRISQL